MPVNFGPDPVRPGMPMREALERIAAMRMRSAENVAQSDAQTGQAIGSGISRGSENAMMLIQRQREIQARQDQQDKLIAATQAQREDELYSSWLQSGLKSGEFEAKVSPDDQKRFTELSRKIAELENPEATPDLAEPQRRDALRQLKNQIRSIPRTLVPRQQPPEPNDVKFEKSSFVGPDGIRRQKHTRNGSETWEVVEGWYDDPNHQGKKVWIDSSGPNYEKSGTNEMSAKDKSAEYDKAFDLLTGVLDRVPTHAEVSAYIAQKHGGLVAEPASQPSVQTQESSPAMIQRTLKNGSKVNVIPLPGGRFLPVSSVMPNVPSAPAAPMLPQQGNYQSTHRER